MQQLIKLTGKSSVPESWARNYTYALDTLPKEEISFLTDAHLTRVKERIRFSEERLELLSNVFSVIRNDADLRFLTWLWHCILFRKPDLQGEHVASWPLPLQTEGSEVSIPDLFPVVVLLSGYDRIDEIYEKVGNIPKDIQIQTLSKVDDSMNMFQENRGKEGLSTASLDWFYLHFHGKLFSIGRLEFEIKPFGDFVQVYRHKNGEIIALSRPGIRYRRDGHVDGTNQIYDEQSWVATLVETEREVTGYPLTEDGYVTKQSVSLDKSEWSLVLNEGDDILNVHIPRRGEFTFESCQEAYTQAITFFETCFPDKKFKAFVCISWLMNFELRHMLKETSNLIAFQKQYTLFPLLADDKGVYKFVFRCDPCPVDELPETTSLQKKIKQFMQAGNYLQRVGGFMIIS